MVINSTSRLSRIISASLLTAGLYSCGSGTETNSDFTQVDPSVPVEGWELVWSDEFDGTAIDASKWTHEVNCQGGGNQEKQCYTDSADNSYVADGMLHIVALPAEEGSPLPYTSARMVTKDQGDFTYGRFEMRAKMPQGQGTWPAFWMLPTDYEYGGWPKSGEIDIVEAVNLKTVNDEGVEEAYIYGTLHYGREWPNNDSSGKPYLLPAGMNPADDFHTYAIEWQEGEIRWYVDDYLYATQQQSVVRYNSNGDAVGLVHKGWYVEQFNPVTGELETVYDAAPFDQRFHMILNLAVGGSWPENVNNLGIDASAFEDGGQQFLVDWVRVYQCSANPSTGKGCDTVRAGYLDPEDALVEGAAPVPSLPVPPTVEPLTIFSDAENPYWPMWDCCGGTTPEVVMDDAEHGAVARFEILDNNGTVLGFNSRNSDEEDAGPFNASGMLTNGNLSFEMKVVNAPAGSPDWRFKVESDNVATELELSLTDSVEGVLPTTGEWQTYTYPLQMLADGGLDLSAIDVVMIFPAWGAGAGSVFLVDNFKIEPEGGVASPELVLFEDEMNPDWPLWDCCGGSTPTEEMDDEEHGIVAEFVIGAEPTVMGFLGREGGNQFDATSILSNGVVQFEMKVVTDTADPDTPWLFKIESNNTETELEVNLNTSVEGADPVTGEWQTYTFPLTDLSDGGLDVSAIDVVMIFPAWGAGTGAVYRVDNAKIYDPTATSGGSSGPLLAVFAEGVNEGWPLWDCCGGTTPEVVVDDAEHGSVAQFTINNNDGTVLGFFSRDAGEPFDASAILSTGVLQFEMKVVNAPADGTPWLLKVEANGAASELEVNLNTSQEGVDPVTGEWQTYTFDLLSMSDAGFDVSAIDVIMIFPAWGSGAGAVYRVDNVYIGNPSDISGGTSGGGDGGASSVAYTIFADQMNEGWPMWDCCGGTTPTVEMDDDAHGAVAEFMINDNNGTVMGFFSRDTGQPFDASSILTTGKFQFEMKVVSPPAEGTAWLMKIESNGAATELELPLDQSNEGMMPVTGEWQTYTFDLLALFDAGLDVSAIDVVMMFPAWGAGAGSVYRVDNVVFLSE